jgi:nitrous oxidase accessory protein
MIPPVARRLAVAACLVVAWANAPAANAPPTDHGTWLQDRLAAAAPGEVIDVPAGEHRGPFVVARPVHLRGHGQALLRGDGKTHVVAIRAPDVVLEGFEIRDSGLNLMADHAAIHVTGPRAVIRGNRIADSLHGVYVRQADHVRVEANTITGKSWTLELVNPFAGPSGPGEAETCEVTLAQDRRGNGLHFWNSSGHVVAGNVIRDTRDGIYFSFVDRSEIRNNDVARARYGLHYMYSDDNRFDDNVFRDNAAGAALMYSQGLVLRRNQFTANRSQRAYGLLLHSVDQTEIRDNELTGNTLGLFMENGQANRVLDNLVTNNHVGVHIGNSSNENVFAGNTFAGNVHPVETAGDSASNRWADAGRGNYWQGAARLDLNADGIGDLPHRELDLFGEWRRPFPVIGLLAGSPGERLLRFVYSRLALPGLAGVSDPAPLVRSQHR